MQSTGKKRVAIVDYRMGNLFSVARACENVGLDMVITSDREVILKADAVILPGVGAFGDAMDNLKDLDLVEPLKDCVRAGKPFLGICLGFQLLMTESEEFGTHQGLDIFKGRVVKFPAGKVPQVGWNRVHSGREGGFEGTLLNGVSPGEYMYFVHSYYVAPESAEATLSVTTYEGVEYCSSLASGRVFACQFHPEKSAGPGLQVYKNFRSLIEGKEK